MKLDDFYDRTGKAQRVEVLDGGARVRVYLGDAWVEYERNGDTLRFAGMQGFTREYGPPRAAFTLAYRAAFNAEPPPPRPRPVHRRSR